MISYELRESDNVRNFRTGDVQGEKVRQRGEVGRERGNGTDPKDKMAVRLNFVALTL